MIPAKTPKPTKTPKLKGNKKPEQPEAPPWPAGLTILAVRPMTPGEAAAEHWHIDNINGPPPVICLSDGSKLYAAADTDGNAPGALFGVDGKSKKTIRLM